MNKSSRNLGAVLAVMVLLLLIAGLVFVVVTVYKDPLQAEIASQESSAMESATETTETEPVYVAPKRIALFETADINGYLMNTTSGDPETFEYRLAYVAKVVENARENEDYDDVILIDGGDIFRAVGQFGRNGHENDRRPFGEDSETDASYGSFFMPCHGGRLSWRLGWLLRRGRFILRMQRHRAK